MSAYCSNCGVAQKGDEKFCAKCGQSLTTNTSQKELKNTEVPKKHYGVLSSFNISEEEFKSQVENHDSLPFSKSVRGIAVITIMVLLAIGIVIIVALNLFTSDSPISYSDLFWSLVIYAPLLYFVYKGHLWAIVALGIFYTVDKFYSTFILSSSHFNISAVIFWIIGAGPLWVAFRVEREYRKRKAVNASA